MGALLIFLIGLAGAVARPVNLTLPGPGRSLLSPAAGCLEVFPGGCCYNPTWWLDQQVQPSIKCIQNGQNTPADSSIIPGLLQACSNGYIASSTPCITTGTGATICGLTDPVSCSYYESIGDYTGGFPCSTQQWNGQTFQVYDSSNLRGNNDEIVWADMTVLNGNEPTGVQNCNSGSTATVTLTGSYSKASSWNVGVKLDVKLLDIFTAGLSGGYSQTFTVGQSVSVGVQVPSGSQGTITQGTLVHHSIGWMDVKLPDSSGCKEYRIDNVASDIVRPTSDPDFPISTGTEVKPCGYPLLNGAH